jgi:[ribosomal protein S18]-alanine N-acetyltransferase
LACWQLTRATPADIAALVALENRCFGWPWSRLSFEGEMNAPGADSRVTWTTTAAGQPRMIAYIFFRFIAAEVHIFRIAVDPAWRRRGVGARLVTACLESARGRGLSAAMLEVRRSNTEALKLYRKFGFQVAATRPGYYSDGHEDALILTQTLT